MDDFVYKNQALTCEQVPVSEVVEAHGTPTYLYSSATFSRHLQLLQEAFAPLSPMICYSVKGCSNINILKLLADQGSGFDVVSGGELSRVLEAGGAPSKTVYAGVGKTDAELNQAIDAGIAWFNIESEEEFLTLARIAADRKQQVAAAIRINPDVDPKTHKHTTTGKKETKFGIDIDRAMAFFEQHGRNDFVSLSAIHIHIGSPVYTVDPYRESISKTLELIGQLRAKGFTIDTLDIGGGFGADYVAGQTPPFHHYAEAIVPLLQGQGLKLVLEPGRSVSGNAGILITRVLYNKQGGNKRFAIVDAAMNDLLRPSLYDAFHFIWPVHTPEGFLMTERKDPGPLPETVKVDVVGPICETGDYLARDRSLPPLKRGDLLAVFTAGAYGFAMSSQYNSRPRAAEVLVEGDRFRLIRRRETYNDLVALEREPGKSPRPGRLSG